MSYIGQNYPVAVVDSTSLAPYMNNRNLIINGDFTVWQRGETFIDSYDGLVTADRWYVFQNGETGTVDKNISNAAPEWNGLPSIEIANVGVTPNSGKNIQTRIEDVNRFQNKNVTLSLVHNGVIGQDINIELRQYDDLDVQLWTSGVLLIGTGDGTIRKDSITVYLPDIATVIDRTNSYFKVLIKPFSNDTSTINVGMVQLEEGSVATDFEYVDPGTQQAKCERYYQTSNPTMNTTTGMIEEWTVVARGDLATMLSAVLHGTMRIAPTVNVYSVNSGLVDKMYNSTLAVDVSISISSQSPNRFSINNASGALVNAGTQFRYQWKANAEL